MSKRRSNAPWIILGVVVAGGLAWFLLRPRAAPVALPRQPMMPMMPPMPAIPQFGGGMMMPPLMPSLEDLLSGWQLVQDQPIVRPAVVHTPRGPYVPRVVQPVPVEPPPGRVATRIEMLRDQIRAKRVAAEQKNVRMARAQEAAAVVAGDARAAIAARERVRKAQAAMLTAQAAPVVLGGPGAVDGPRDVALLTPY